MCIGTSLHDSIVGWGLDPTEEVCVTTMVVVRQRACGGVKTPPYEPVSRLISTRDWTRTGISRALSKAPQGLWNPAGRKPPGRAFRFPHGSCTCRASRNVSYNKKHPAFQQGASCLHDPYGNRTHVTAVKGPCLNRLTNGPKRYRILLKQQATYQSRLQPAPKYFSETLH